MASLVSQRLKHLPAVQETWVRSLGQEDPLEKGMATHSSILAWRIPWMEEPGGRAIVYQVAKNWTRLSDFTFSLSQFSLGEGNGTLPQYSCLENPVDGGAWWAAVHGVAQVGHD